MSSGPTAWTTAILRLIRLVGRGYPVVPADKATAQTRNPQILESLKKVVQGTNKTVPNTICRAILALYLKKGKK
jgi:hypothetical protein